MTLASNGLHHVTAIAGDPQANAALETGGVLVSDKIDLEFEISAIKQN